MGPVVNNSEDEYAAPRLLFVEEPWAFFYAGPDIESVRGGNWDRPFHASQPIAIREDVEITRVAFTSSTLRTPEAVSQIIIGRPCAFSVDEINEGNIPWLQPIAHQYHERICFGDSLGKFIQIVENSGGKVYTSK